MSEDPVVTRNRIAAALRDLAEAYEAPALTGDEGDDFACALVDMAARLFGDAHAYMREELGDPELDELYDAAADAVSEYIEQACAGIR